MEKGVKTVKMLKTVLAESKVVQCCYFLHESEGKGREQQTLEEDLPICRRLFKSSTLLGYQSSR